MQDLTEIFLADNDLAPTDLYNGTDSTFSPVLRDSKGLPVNKINCENNRIEPASLCENIDKLEETEKKRRERFSSDTQTDDDSSDLTESTTETTTKSAIENTIENGDRDFENGINKDESKTNEEKDNK